jgi:hypothetical protein
MPQQKLNNNQIMTIGANELASLVVPNGWMAKRIIRIAQETPMMVAICWLVSICICYHRIDLRVVMFGEATSIPWIAPRTDYEILAYLPAKMKKKYLSGCQNSICHNHGYT